MGYGGSITNHGVTAGGDGMKALLTDIRELVLSARKKDWERKLDDFLRFNERRVLPSAGKISKHAAEGHENQRNPWMIWKVRHECKIFRVFRG